MRKLVLSLVALLTMTIVGQAANTISFETKSTTAKSLGNNKDTIPTFKLGAVTFLTDNSGSTVYKNGWIRNDTTWVLYRDHGNGPLNVKADEGYWIKDLTMTYYENSKGILSTVTGESKSSNPLLASNYPILFNGDERQFYVAKSQTGTGGFICISNFTVTYFLNPTAIALEDMTVSLGNQFQMIPTFSPAKSFAWCDWESDNSGVVAIDKNGVINAKAAGKATITATLGSLSASCEVTVVDNSKDESVVEDFSGHGTINDYTNSVNKLMPGTSGFSWGNRNIRRSANDMIDGKQGVSLQYRVGSVVKDRDKNYFAYADAKQEGGVKRISFQWRAIDSTKNVMFQIDDCVNNPITFFSFYPASAENMAVHTLTQDVNFAKNFQFRVKLSDIASSNVVFGPMTITPYLLYKTKSAEANGKYTNKDLINNTPDTATIVYTLEGNDGEASIDAATGEVTCLAEGEVTVRATWGAVSTTYTLKTHVKLIPEMSFEADTVNKDFSDAPFINALTTTAGVGDTTYMSSNMQVATVAANGEVTIVGVGQTTITASVAATSTYAAKSASYVLNVAFAPAAGTFWKETMSKVPTGIKNYTGTDKYVGDSSVYKWSMTYYQRQPDDMVGNQQGTRIRYSGALAMDGVQEGGIKDVCFDYRAANQVNPIHFNVKVDGVDYDYYHDALPVKGTIVTYIHRFEAKKNTMMSLEMSAQETPQQGYPIIGQITIVPYLLYTNKSMERKQEDGKFTNTALINNAEGNVVYSVEGENASQIASIDASTGEVTILGEGVVTVKATWGDVYTTYTLVAHTKTLPKISFDADTINKDMLDAAFVNALTTSFGVGDTTYMSSNKQVATVAANGEVTIVGVGQTIITATIAENATYAAASASYVLNVGFTPEEGTFWKETFSKRNPNSSKNMNPIETVGDSAVYNWVLTNYDYNGSDNFDGVIGVRVRYDGSIVNEFMEGGVKALTFQWRPSNASNYIHYTMAVGEDTTVFDSDPIQSINYTFARKYEQKSNTSFKFTIDTAGLKNTVAFLGISPITVVPYLLYTQKSVDLTKEDVSELAYKFTNTALINNAEGNVVYSIDGGSESATIDAATGEVTIVSAGTVTVQATWNDVYTSYTLNIISVPTQLDATTQSSASPVQKALINNRLYILRNNCVYDVQGNLIR